jgi:hypothetical protein
MRYLALVVMLGFCLRGWGQDTIVLADKSKILVKVLKATEYGIKYTKWEDSTGSKHHLDLSQALKIKYSDGRIEVFDQNTGAVYWVKRPEPNTDSIEHAQQSIVHRPEAKLSQPFEVAKYDSIMHLHRALFVPGVVLITLGPVSMAVGFGLVSSITLPFPVQITGFVLTIVGTSALIGGIVDLALAGRFKRIAIKYKKGQAYLLVPQPDFMLPTTQNNFQKGFGVNWGLQF